MRLRRWPARLPILRPRARSSMPATIRRCPYCSRPPIRPTTRPRGPRRRSASRKRHRRSPGMARRRSRMARLGICPARCECVGGRHVCLYSGRGHGPPCRRQSDAVRTVHAHRYDRLHDRDRHDDDQRLTGDTDDHLAWPGVDHVWHGMRDQPSSMRVRRRPARLPILRRRARSSMPATIRRCPYCSRPPI